MGRRLDDLQVQVADACDQHVENAQISGAGPQVHAVYDGARQALARSKIGYSGGIDFWREPPTEEDIEALDCP